VFGNNKPNCIIIDEIDGLWSGGGGQNPMLTILKLLKGESKTGEADGDGGDEEAGGSSKKKSKTKLAPVCRPIICICNDQYAPVLRPLRQEALVVTFKHGNHSRLPERLREICHKEGLQVDVKALANLADMTEHDIRACLNTLQFLRAKKAGTSITSAMLLEAGVGQKDMKKSLFSVWELLFHVGKPRKNDVTSLQISPTNFFNSLSSVIDATEDPDILLAGTTLLLHTSCLSDPLTPILFCLRLFSQLPLRTLRRDEFHQNWEGSGLDALSGFTPDRDPRQAGVRVHGVPPLSHPPVLPELRLSQTPDP